MSSNRAGLESLPVEEKDSSLKGGVVSTSDDPDNEFGGKVARKMLERKLLWKLDLRMSIMVVIYILNYVNSRIGFPFERQTDDEDRSTETMPGMRTTLLRLNRFPLTWISAVRARGLTTDLHLAGEQFATLLSILYVGYIIMQIPS